MEKKKKRAYARARTNNMKTDKLDAMLVAMHNLLPGIDLKAARVSGITTNALTKKMLTNIDIYSFRLALSLPA